MKCLWVLLCALIVLVHRIQAECISNCTGVNITEACAYNGCFFNAELCSLSYFNCHRQLRGANLFFVASMGLCTREHVPRCTTLDV
ncbi:uncharacterized protein LOC111519859 [Drosophila willistoni]|uniref:uncharacterized protein LOC111519859 n=1 Tax=Drosophila willistoni TaxID=7260 RepID=UPI000C26D524|nr:uncharacterized protein LOC111519859 [Drosophila willistoni]